MEAMEAMEAMVAMVVDTAATADMVVDTADTADTADMADTEVSHHCCFIVISLRFVCYYISHREPGSNDVHFFPIRHDKQGTAADTAAGMHRSASPGAAPALLFSK